MASTSLAKDLKTFEDFDIDELLSKLTPEEIEELSNDIDPDNSLLPPSQRCREQTKKPPTGPFDRDHLINYLERHAKEQPDKADPVPYETGKVRGKKWQQPATPATPKLTALGDDAGDFDELLKQASEEELCDLAAILGLTGMMNQVQYHASVSSEATVQGMGGFSCVARAAELREAKFEPPNTTNVEESINKLRKNDKALLTLNLNNIAIGTDTLLELFDSLKNNSVLVELHVANTQCTDAALKTLCEALLVNKTLRVLNLESNRLTGEGILRVFESLAVQQTLRELRLVNQRQRVLGVKVETKLMDAILANSGLLKVGLDFEIINSRVRVNDHLQQNLDKTLRVVRQAEKSGQKNGSK